MNFLHDFDDGKCLDILANCLKLCYKDVKFIIIEDILSNELEPPEVIMHGLRLAVECRGGRQRTADEYDALFSKINYKTKDKIKLNGVQTMLVLEWSNK
jgi:hypothetical protein